LKKSENFFTKKKLSESKANFTCCISIGFPSGKSYEFLGKVFGKVTFPPKGKKGFGYDPIFVANKEFKNIWSIACEVQKIVFLTATKPSKELKIL